MSADFQYKKGDKIGGRYLVHQALRGGMGEVYLCLDLQHPYPLALKTFQSRYLHSSKLLNSFNREVQHWMALGAHPNIVRCFYREVVDNKPFIFLEWITSDLHQGADLRSLLELGALDTKLALNLIIDICRGLDYAGRMRPGIVHRDLKPDNILIGQRGIAKITDFGMAKVLGEANADISGTGRRVVSLQSFVSRSGHNTVGTPEYMAPEQWEGTEQDARTDMYAVGCILYEMLSGEMAFKATDMDGFRDRHLAAPVATLPPDSSLYRELNIVLEQCMAKRREERFATVSVLLQRISSIYEAHFNEKPRAVAGGQGFTGIDYTNRGVTYCDLKLYGAALRDHNSAIESDPEEGRFYTNRGITYDALKQYDLAIADFTRSINLDPGDEKAFYNRGISHIHLRQYEKALNDFDRVTQINSKYALAYTSRGLAYLRLGRLKEALQDQDMAIKIDATLVPAYINRGVILVELKCYKEAQQNFSIAMRLDPSEPDIYVNMGALHALNKNLPQAWGLFEKAAELGHPRAAMFAERARREFFSNN